MDSKNKAQVNHLLDKKRLDFRVVELVYILHRLEQHVCNEDLKKLEEWTITVFILLLNDHVVGDQIPSYFLAPKMIEYQKSSFFISLVELCMEFYIKVLQMLLEPRHAFFNTLVARKQYQLYR
jgi:hypothetical protein